MTGKLGSVWHACRPQVVQAPPASGPPSQALALPGVLAIPTEDSIIRAMLPPRTGVQVLLGRHHAGNYVGAEPVAGCALAGAVEQLGMASPETSAVRRCGRGHEMAAGFLLDPGAAHALDCAAGVSHEEWDLELGPSAMRVQKKPSGDACSRFCHEGRWASGPEFVRVVKKRPAASTRSHRQAL